MGRLYNHNKNKQHRTKLPISLVGRIIIVNIAILPRFLYLFEMNRIVIPKKGMAGPFPFVCNQIPSSVTKILEGSYSLEECRTRRRLSGYVDWRPAHRHGDQWHCDKETVEL